VGFNFPKRFVSVAEQPTTFNHFYDIEPNLGSASECEITTEQSEDLI